MSYMIEGKGSKTLSKAKKWLYTHPEASMKLLQLLTDVNVDYLVGQVKAGAQMLQVFESHAEHLDEELFNKFCLPVLTQICSRVKKALRDDDIEPVPMVSALKLQGLVCNSKLWGSSLYYIFNIFRIFLLKIDRIMAKVALNCG